MEHVRLVVLPIQVDVDSVQVIRKTAEIDLTLRINNDEIERPGYHPKPNAI
jgi:hypothetical protein